MAFNLCIGRSPNSCNGGRSSGYGATPAVVSAAFLLMFLLSARSSLCSLDPFTCSDYAGTNDGLPATTGSPVCAASDRRALLRFKASISSDPNHVLANWTAAASYCNCCSWNGITCDSTGRVVRVKLPQLRLKGAISSSLGALSALRVLILDGNDFSGGLPASLGKLSHLQRLCISSNPSISGSVPASFGKLRKLQLLDLSSNALSGTLPTNIGGMSSLLRLRLDGNKIGGSIPPSFGLLSQLSTANLADNQLSGCVPDGFAFKLSSLAFLFLKNNSITGLPTDLRNLSTLQWVDLSNNPIVNGEAVAGLATAPLITQISLANCGLKGPFPSWVSRLPQPDFRFLSDEVTPSLVLSSNAIAGPIPAAVGNLTRLQMLYLDHNQLTGSIPASFSALEYLGGFNVSYNMLRGSIPQVKPFTTFRASAYQPGNSGLCGTPLGPCKK